jgi:hypothetical protein
LIILCDWLQQLFVSEIFFKINEAGKVDLKVADRIRNRESIKDIEINDKPDDLENEDGNFADLIKSDYLVTDSKDFPLILDKCDTKLFDSILDTLYQASDATVEMVSQIRKHIDQLETTIKNIENHKELDSSLAKEYSTYLHQSIRRLTHDKKIVKNVTSMIEKEITFTNRLVDIYKRVVDAKQEVRDEYDKDPKAFVDNHGNKANK